MYTYLFENEEHSDTSLEYMQNLGMSQDLIETIWREKERMYPTPTFESELTELNEKHEQELKSLTDAFCRAIALNGSEQSNKTNQISEKINQANADYELAVSELALKYFGEQ